MPPPIPEAIMIKGDAIFLCPADSIENEFVHSGTIRNIEFIKRSFGTQFIALLLGEGVHKTRPQSSARCFCDYALPKPFDQVRFANPFFWIGCIGPGGK